MVFPLVCSTCGKDLSEARYRLLVEQMELKKVVITYSRKCCRLKLSTQIEPYRNLTVQPSLDIN
ncbi:RNA polymerase subunit RPO7 [Penguinpox virus]|uniref:DNA-directed RNA polymerase 7 kDa subunit n=2 Tax=Avipoxvirus TaxID=10260 RepID=A0A2H4X2E6_9POXV|nr:RNA polymerase subunit RPO7 [Penguinpox virus]YP_009448037.1 RNA polymerase subunit 7 [Flamingopox virus FGPVKD09]WCB86983.1 CPPV172 RNA polymerase subunit RPO7 [Cooks petrelpox virus]WIK87471.1 RNA polymerase subunit RPO7 [Oriental turtle dovepox virus]AID46856.1 RNA polymerase subunit RPO7 [Penguinpox virus]AUD40222.1 RNA polymerase subunit 7 [Flamingopox virus FGPVKD09]